MARTWNRRPSSEAWRSTSRSCGSRRSMRAASTPSMLGGSVALPLRADGEQLLEEQRVALGGGHDALGRRGVEPVGERVHERPRVRAVERLELEQRAVGVRRGPAGPRLEQLGPGEAEQQDRRAARERQRVLDEVEQRRVGPVRVLDHGEQRALARRGLEHAADRPGGLAGLRGLVGAARARRARAGRSRRRGRRPRAAPGSTPRRARRSTPRMSCASGRAAAAAAIGMAAAERHRRRRRPGARHQLAGEPRLADPRRADHGEAAARSRLACAARSAARSAASSRARATNGPSRGAGDVRREPRQPPGGDLACGRPRTATGAAASVTQPAAGERAASPRRAGSRRRARPRASAAARCIASPRARPPAPTKTSPDATPIPIAGRAAVLAAERVGERARAPHAARAPPAPRAAGRPRGGR